MGWMVIIVMLLALVGTLVVAVVLLRRGAPAGQTAAQAQDADRPTASTIIQRNTEESRAIQDQIYREMEALRGRQ